MKNNLVQSFISFLRESNMGQRPLLLAFSGGPDSRALLELILECKKIFPREVHLAHIDHGWRKESAAEAQSLKDLCHSYGLIWHQLTLSKEDFSGGNEEDLARQYRYHFFEKVYKEIHAEALFIAHQKEDLAETVLKRIFEGAALYNLGGMRPDSMYRGMRVLRPLLCFPKQDLLDWLHERGVNNYVIDSTNLSQNYLRGRMRVDMFPYLEKVFGKNIVSNLVAISEESYLLKDGDAEFFSGYLSCIHHTEMCSYLDGNDLCGLPEGRMFHFLQYLFNSLGLLAQRSIVQSITESFLNGKVSKAYQLGSAKIYVEGRYIFVFFTPPPNFSSLDIASCNDKRDGWEISSHVGIWEPPVSSVGWERAIRGQLLGYIFEDHSQLIYPQDIKDSKIRSSVLQRFSSAKVPVCLRSLFPVLISKDGEVVDFLTDCNLKNINLNTNRIIKVSVSFKIIKRQ